MLKESTDYGKRLRLDSLRWKNTPYFVKTKYYRGEILGKCQLFDMLPKNERGGGICEFRCEHESSPMKSNTAKI